MFGFAIEIAEGEMTLSGWDGSLEWLAAMADSTIENMEAIPLPDRFSEVGGYPVVAFVRRGEDSTRTSYRVQGMERMVQGPVVIAKGTEDEPEPFLEDDKIYVGLEAGDDGIWVITVA